jgi:hypothetical protein
MANNFIKILITIVTLVFSIACGLLLVRFTIPLYFKIFSPIPQTLYNFYIVISIFVLLIILLDMIVFKKGEYNWGIWISGTFILLFVFGIPIFMLENNNMLWQQAVSSKSGPVYLIEFSNEKLLVLKHCQNLYKLIWETIYSYVYADIIIYLVGYCYLWKLGWRINGVRIKP